MGTPGREMRIPLLEEQEEVVPDRITSVLVLSAFFAVCGSYVFGNAVSYSSPAESGIMDELGLSLAEYSVFGSLLTVGGLLGALCSGKIADLIGRRGAMWVIDVAGIIGWCAIFLSESAWSLDLGRLLLGFGVGLASYVVPVYIAEVTPKNLRGGFVSLCMLVIACGMSMTYIIGTVLNWRILACLGTPQRNKLVGLFLVPESPRWLAKIGRERDMEAALQRLRGKNADISKETSEIEIYIETLQEVSEYRIFYIFQRKYAQALTVGLGLMVFQQLGGLNAYAFYMSSILERAGASSTAGSITTAIVQLAANIAAVFLMDKFGRRPLLLVSASGACLAGFLIGLSFLLQDYHQSTDVVSALTFIGIVVFTGFFSIGLGGIPWIIMAEIFPINVKGSAGSLVNLVSWIGSWLVAYTFSYFFEWSSAGVFFVFSGICCSAILFIAKMVPETKGRTLEEIEASMTS
ncbi:sugar transporter ERD6-like 5 isoform X2 [Rhodamnia argentea]|uniref:Sugar transporter ERD6-like 5 isoform X2 n=1 Tax=Rhodamnia argentea TaxID=178133 RepID=A0A8B8PKC1_9MYRT|nr:sugar transporter ERD6-like 5 isoform X2 [Rhodamnia argentea]